MREEPRVSLGRLDDPGEESSPESIQGLLGSSSPLWFDLVEYLADRYPPITEEWAFPGQKYGWSLRLVRRKRRIVYMTPQKEQFTVGVVLGDRAVAAANKSSLPATILEEINGARRYAEGRGVRIEVTSAEDLRAIKLLADNKMAD